MSIKRICEVGLDDVLEKKSEFVENINEDIITLLDDIIDTMNSTGDAVGLAAPQIGVSKRVASVKLRPDGKLFEMINPEIIASRGLKLGTEGCLSFPGRYGKVKRPKWIRVKYMDRNGVWQEFEAEDFLARVFCHEIDHLNGILFSSKVITWVK